MSVVLIVDDEAGVRRVLERWLAAPDRTIISAESADEALARMAETPAGVVFCDIQMPGRDGLWLTAELRRRYPLAAVVLATSVSTVAPNVSMQSGVLAYVVKPFTREAILEAYDTALHWHRETAANGPDPADNADRLQAWLDAL
jgi:DNA-binding NtrC family response regulator